MMSRSSAPWISIYSMVCARC